MLQGDVQEALVSTAQLQQAGNLVYFPANQTGVCWVIAHSSGKIVAHADHDYIIDLAAIGDPFTGTATFTTAGDLVIHAPSSTFARVRPSARKDALVTLRLAIAKLRRLTSTNSCIPSKLPLKEKVQYWHEALGHPSQALLSQIARYTTLEGLNITEENVRAFPPECAACEVGNTRRAIVSETATRPLATHVGEHVWLDTYGNYKVKSAGGNNHVFHFVDEFSRFSFPAVAKGTKDASAANAATRAAAAFFRLHGHPFQHLHADADPVFTAAEHQDFLLQEEQVHSHLAPPGVHERNGIPERLHQHIKRRVTVMYVARTGRYVPRSLYMYAVVLADTLRNITPHSHLPHDVSPWEIFFKEKPDLRRIKILPFGQPVAIHAPAPARTSSARTPKPPQPWKFTPPRRLAMYLGPSFLHPGCINVYCPDTRTVVVSGDFTVLDFIPPEWENPQVYAAAHDLNLEGPDDELWAKALAPTPGEPTILLPLGSAHQSPSRDGATTQLAPVADAASATSKAIAPAGDPTTASLALDTGAPVLPQSNLHDAVATFAEIDDDIASVLSDDASYSSDSDDSLVDVTTQRARGFGDPKDAGPPRGGATMTSGTQCPSLAPRRASAQCTNQEGAQKRHLRTSS